ncbi:MAG: Non-specific protein-tyrosine kinase [Oscillospiraceae bacterium]|jgi:polysaccharide biosynthesis transport protein
MELFVSFSEVMRYYKRNWMKLLLVVLAFGIFGSLLSVKFARPVYQGSTVFTVTCGVPDSADSDYHLQYTNILYSRVQSAVALASGSDLLTQTAQEVGVDPSEITNITAKMENSSPVVKLTVSTTNAAKTAQISDTAAELLMQRLIKQFPDPVLTASITDHAAEVQPQSRKSAIVKAGILGMILGCIVVLCFGILAVLCDKTIRNGRFAEEMLKVRLLAEIPHETKDRENAIRTLRASALNAAGNRHSFLVTNVCENDGGEEIALDFSKTLAVTGKSVLLVDCDLRSPKLAKILNINPQKTLNHILSGECGLSQAVVSAEQNGISFLAGAPVNNAIPSDLFATETFAKFVEEAAATYDYVVFYAPSEIHFPDAESLVVHAKQVILSVKYGKTPLNTLKESCCRIKAAGGDVLGFVATNA